MRYFKKADEGLHKDWGDPVYLLEVGDEGHAVRQLVCYPNGNTVSYDDAHVEDEHGALAIMVVDGDESWWAQFEISKAEFEAEWQKHSPMNR